MANSERTTPSLVTAATHPADAAADLSSEVARGRSWRTPFLALGGTAFIVAAVVVVIIAVVFATYSIAK
jgi:hypothetical protein